MYNVGEAGKRTRASIVGAGDAHSARLGHGELGASEYVIPLRPSTSPQLPGRVEQDKNCEESTGTEGKIGKSCSLISCVSAGIYLHQLVLDSGSRGYEV